MPAAKIPSRNSTALEPKEAKRPARASPLGKPCYRRPSTGSGGRYVRVRMAFPNVDEFVAGGYVQAKAAGKITNRPHYVVFHS